MAEREPGSDELTRVEDSALVERVKAGDRAAFGELVRRHMRRAFSVAYRMLEHREDAEDLVQDAFIAALEKIDGFQSGRPFAPWFFRLLVNRGYNARKARSLRATDPIPADAPSVGVPPDLAAERSALRDRLGRALEGLTERQREIVRLFELEGFSGAEIAEILEVSEPTVRWHLHQARKALREAFTETDTENHDA